ncbi:glutamyl-tRNA(Gln) amidotransferase subunit E [Methanothermus fervidus DSM 2088]|uniref:Glutamyl-tRNA(Gln) amidotransferase subunit E n=1 Tax=Methanothermus fervidus (strain ATCC 43054 / DSM 2088 / JCM 10308 / V24 S) TaxID=523846 RepID=E3GYC6_METFV|nr:Glu-tRNA(Gln) amidotransferase subunit GatE [Methanothermus fervidus]ADP77308.1 glutamyl-tRNA(Gln) amidotransferase subunit E [Methanothermus fervidus DSM 2088]
MDWKKIGLKVGLEIHQQLDTKHKLFCPCKCELIDKDPEFKIFRKLRPTLSELGKFDRAALEEARRKLKFIYQAYTNETCLVEADEEPPHSINKEALEISLTIALLLNMNIVDEFHVMRKQVIDGSNTTGFQRTGLLATNGYVKTPNGKVGIQTLCLEEDAARKVKKTKDGVIFRLDRLGIPLVEIATEPTMNDPEQVKEVAYKIGQILRSTKVKRGIGTIRQDLNISIKDGARVEIKGVQDLDLIPTIVKREVQRQLSLLEIKNELQNRNAQVPNKIYDVKEIFKNTSSKIIANSPHVMAIKLCGFGGLLGKEVQPGRRFGTELSDYAKKRGVGGIIHTDELPAYGISKEETENLKDYLNVSDEDAVVMVVGEKEKCIEALKEVQKRAKLAIKGVPEETRRALSDGNTEYLRPLPTASRMYVETDIPPVPITKEYIEKIKSNLPELPEEKMRRVMSEYNISEDLASQLLKKDRIDIFEKIMEKVNLEGKIVGATLAYSLDEIRREGHDIDKLTFNDLLDVFKLLENKEISKDAINEILAYMTDKNCSAEEAAEKLDLKLLSEDEIKSIIDEIISENIELIKERGTNAIGPIMGMSMKKLRGKADGKVVNKIVTKKIQKLVS